MTTEEKKAIEDKLAILEEIQRELLGLKNANEDPKGPETLNRDAVMSAVDRQVAAVILKGG